MSTSQHPDKNALYEGEQFQTVQPFGWDEQGRPTALIAFTNIRVFLIDATGCQQLPFKEPEEARTIQ